MLGAAESAMWPAHSGRRGAVGQSERRHRRSENAAKTEGGRGEDAARTERGLSKDRGRTERGRREEGAVWPDSRRRGRSGCAAPTPTLRRPSSRPGTE